MCLYIDQKFKLLQFCLYSFSYSIFYDIFAYFILVNFFSPELFVKQTLRQYHLLNKHYFPSSKKFCNKIYQVNYYDITCHIITKHKYPYIYFSEFIPYVFQILALLLELQTNQNIPETYMALFPCLLSPVLFERQANIHPLNRLLQAFISHGSHQIAAQDKTSALLGVFQKLIASKANDHEGFLLIQSIIEYFEP